MKQIQDKMSKLRNYYGAERRKEERSKVSGSGTDAVYTSSWRFYAPLRFLKDNLTPRSTTNNLEHDEESIVYPMNNPPSAKRARLLKEKAKENAEGVMAKASHAMDCITARYQKPPSENKNERGEDGLFADMVYEMLSKIPDCMQKAMAKIEFQQKLIQLKYSIAATPASNIDYFPIPSIPSFSNTFMQQGGTASSTHSGVSLPSYQSFDSSNQGESSGSTTSTPLPSPVFPPF